MKKNGWVNRNGRTVVAAAVLVLVAACGGGGGGGAVEGTASANSAATPSKVEASRFLAQATFGPNEAEIDKLAGMSYGQWIDEQFAKPTTLHRLYINQAAADAAQFGQQLTNTHFYDSWWTQVLGSDDQLRQRVAFALSQILVISFSDATLRNHTRGVASFYDMLADKSFGNYRDLLEGVTFHPMMGIYLSHMKNMKEDPATGQLPDLNFAREISQLFAIGENKLNPDGTVAMGSDGKPLVGYTSADLAGLAKVFTGLSWYAGNETADRTRNRYFGNDPHLERDWRPMQAYDEYAANTSFHSISEKKFFGVTIPASSKPDTMGDVKIALDAIFAHPNVGPFLGKQLIQRLVTSNPSPAYVGRVAAAFNDNGSGVRGDMKAVVKAVLLDSEARAVGTAATAGKVREPLLRVSHMLRAFNATSRTGRWTGIGNTDDPGTRLNQTAMTAPTVFNFYRPGYVPTSQALMAANVVVPEMQITHDVSVAGYTNYIRSLTVPNANADIRHKYDAEVALAETPAALVDHMNVLLFGGTMPEALKTQITSAVASRAIPAPVYSTTNTMGGTLAKIADEGGSFTVGGSGEVRYGANTTFISKTVSGPGMCTNDFFADDPVPGVGKSCFLFTPTPSSASAASGAASAPRVPSNTAAINAAKLDRVYLAVFLSMASPDYLIQK